MVRRGLYRDAPTDLPYAPGYDLVGVVHERGSDVSDDVPAVGQRVAALTVYGAYTEYYVCRDPQHLVPVPEIDDADAVSLVLAWTTAAQMLWRCGLEQDGNGKRLLVHGASGSVGSALVQLAKLQGFHVVGTCSTNKMDFCRELGCDEVVDYTTQHFEEVVEPCDAAFDMVGFDNFRKSHACLTDKGLLVIYGFYEASLTGSTASLVSQFVQQKAWLAWKSWTTSRTSLFYVITTMRQEHPEWFQEDLSRLFQLRLEGKIKPAIFKSMPLKEAALAQQLLAQHEVRGKIVLSVQ